MSHIASARKRRKHYHRGLSAQTIVSAGSSVLLLDYRGYGKSEGKPSEKGLYLDAEAAYDWIVAHGYTPNQIVIHRESLGPRWQPSSRRTGSRLE